MMDFSDIRRTVIVALFSDELLTETLVLKGGNAINLVYGFGSRSSIDIDVSIENDFTNRADFRKRLFTSLRERFRRVGYVLFDEKFVFKPSLGIADGVGEWGGYEIWFKIIEEKTFDALEGDLEKIRRNASVISPLQKRTFKIQISKFEFCAAKIQRTIEDCTIYVYTPAMIALEKLRALCQQMPEYSYVRHKRPRARDFYDIHCVLTEGAVNLRTASSLELARGIFAAKKVPLNLLPRIGDYREFHRQDWAGVEDSVSGGLREFDFYFDFVVQEVSRLEPLWVK
jgi:predicted nucleotidyltransferase component of viral defense system